MRVAILDDARRVENIIVADEAFCGAHYTGRYVVLNDDLWCGIGALWNGEAFEPA